jgi:glycerol-3-phosphate acyltransferase PlsY
MSLSGPILLALALAAAYLLGAVPFAWVLVRLGTGQDLRKVGSGNIGATNAMRAAGRPVGILAFLLDAAKGLVPVVWFGPWAATAADAPLEPAWAAVLAGAAAVVGHCFPIYLGFRGGKGVATGCGALLGLDWRLFAIGGAVWLAVLLISRYVGLASILMGVTFPLAAGFLFGPSHPAVFGAGALLLLILIRHRSNMARMLAGTEPKAFQSRGARTNGGSA